MSQHDTQMDAILTTEELYGIEHDEWHWDAVGWVNARKIIDSHRALTTKLASAQATIAARDARIGELTKALQAYADDRNWNSCYVSEAGEPIEPFSYWCRGGDDESWMIAEVALAATPDQEAAR